MNAPSKAAKPSGTITIHGREYQTVAYRVHQFRETHPNWALTTAVMARDPDCVVVQAAIADDSGRVLATGHAEEYRKASQINRTSALENAETSAIGRALAALGFGGTEFATANEVANAIHQQANPPADTNGNGHKVLMAEARDAPFPQGPCKNKTELKAKGRELWADVLACDDKDALDALLVSHKPLVDQLKEGLPQWWGGGTRDGEAYEGLGQVIEKLERDFGGIMEAGTDWRGNVVRAG